MQWTYNRLPEGSSTSYSSLWTPSVSPLWHFLPSSMVQNPIPLYWAAWRCRFICLEAYLRSCKHRFILRGVYILSSKAFNLMLLILLILHQPKSLMNLHLHYRIWLLSSLRSRLLPITDAPLDSANMILYHFFATITDSRQVPTATLFALPTFALYLDRHVENIAQGCSVSHVVFWTIFFETQRVSDPDASIRSPR